MKFNKIQKKIYDEYVKNGSVWANCPRQCGKTQLLVHIIEQELKNDKKICIKTFNTYAYYNLIKHLKKNLGENYERYSGQFTNEHKADTILCDEIYYDNINSCANTKIICLRTKQHKELNFSYKDIDNIQLKTEILNLKNIIGKECWNIEFNNI